MAFNLPDTLPTDPAALDELRAAAGTEFDEIKSKVEAGDDLTADELERLRYLANAIEQIEEANEAIAAANEAVQAEAEALIRATSDRLGRGGEGDDEGEDTEGTDDGGDGEDGTGHPAEAEDETKDAALVASTRKQTQFRGLNKSKTDDIAPSEPGWVMEATAPGYKPGKVGFGAIAEGIANMHAGKIGKGRASRSAAAHANRPDKGSFAVQALARLERDVKLVNTPQELVSEITRATDQRNLPGKSLVAAGGWCAPSETLYDFCDVPDATDLISLPELTIRRGGVRWPVEPDLSAIFNSFEFFFTNTELEAVDANGDPTAVKNCVEIPCADEFEEIVPDVIGYCVEAGILQTQAWPELIEWFMRSLTQEHLRSVSRRTILDMVAGSTAVTIAANTQLGAGSSILSSLELMATNLRLDKGLARNATIEAVLPSWTHAVIRQDWFNRQGGDPSLTDAAIQAWFTARNIAPQWVGDWQTRGEGEPGDLGATPSLVWPGTVQAILYPAGTWFRAMSNVIEFGVQYPRELLQVNRYSRFFTEDAIAVGKRCNKSLVVTIPICPSGAVGGREFIACNATEAAGAA